jgi:hypothetical protein
MAESHRMTAAQLADKLLQDEHADVLRESVAWMATQLMDAEVASRVGAELGERSPERTTHRNESRQRLLSTKAGDVELRIPKLAMCCVNRGVGQHEMVAGASRGRVGGEIGTERAGVGLVAPRARTLMGWHPRSWPRLAASAVWRNPRGRRRAWDEVEPHSYVGVCRPLGDRQPLAVQPA